MREFVTGCTMFLLRAINNFSAIDATANVVSAITVFMLPPFFFQYTILKSLSAYRVWGILLHYCSPFDSAQGDVISVAKNQPVTPPIVALLMKMSYLSCKEGERMLTKSKSEVRISRKEWERLRKNPNFAELLLESLWRIFPLYVTSVISLLYVNPL